MAQDSGENIANKRKKTSVAQFAPIWEGPRVVNHEVARTTQQMVSNVLKLLGRATPQLEVVTFLGRAPSPIEEICVTHLNKRLPIVELAAFPDTAESFVSAFMTPRCAFTRHCGFFVERGQTYALSEHVNI